MTPLIPFVLHAGDLLFQLAGASAMSDAIVGATARDAELQFDHVAIVCMDSIGNPLVIEASPQEGVRTVCLDSFLEEAVKIDGQPGVVVMRLVSYFPMETIVENAMSHISEPYDWYYLPDNGMTYCSELIYDSYIDAEGRHIFEAHPMNFRNPDGSLPSFWEELYEGLGQPVPEGIPGTNPQDLSKSPKLIEVYRYFLPVSARGNPED